MGRKIHLQDYVRIVPDFPVSGVSFKDITPLLGDAYALKYAFTELAYTLPPKNITTVISPESRGFIFGPLLAHHVGANFVMVRKQKSLVPSDTNILFNSKKEYGEDVLGFDDKFINHSGFILFHDDVLASGNTALSIYKAINTLADNVYFNFLVELEFLGGRKLLRDAGIQDSHIKSIIKYK